MENRDKNTDKGGVQPIIEVVKAVESVKTEIGKEINKSEIKRAEFESWLEYTLKK